MGRDNEHPPIVRPDLEGKERLLLVDVAFPNPRIMNNGWRAEDGPVENFSLRCREIESTLIFYRSLSLSVSLFLSTAQFSKLGRGKHAPWLE